MADPVLDPNAAAPAAAPTAPAPAAPAPAPASATPPPSAAEPVAGAQAATVTAAAPVVVPTPTSEPPPSILSEAQPPKPAEPAPGAAEPPKPAEATPPPAASAVTVTFEPFKVPDGVALDQARVGEVTTALGKLVTDNKVPQEAAQALGQQMVDMHLAEMAKHAKAQQDFFEQTRTGWRDSFKADPEIGGPRTEATIAACGSMIEQFGGSKEQIAELRKAFRITGMGDHPGMIRFIANMAKALGEGQPVPAVIPRSLPPTTRAQRRYGNSSGNTNGAS